MASEQNKKVDVSLLWKEFPQFEGSQFRVHGEGKDAVGSVHDLITLVLGSSNTAHKAWHDIKKRVLTGSNDPSNDAIADIVKRTRDVQINGRGKLTPVAPFRTLLEIIFLLPGKRAHEFRKTCAQYIARLLSGDLSLIDEIEARYDNSTREEREFFRNGTDETPERKRRREELEEDRRMRLKREAAEITRLEMENQKMGMENLAQYEALLERLGLGRDPRLRQLVNDFASNMLLPSTGHRAVEGSALADYVTVGKFLVDRGIKGKSPTVLGRHVAAAWREETGREPETTQMVVNGDVRTVKLYPAGFLERHAL